ncbi:MAG TPA: nicotinate-nucleotide adenylyltransferase [Acidimicrobiales bacterium]
MPGPSRLGILGGTFDPPHVGHAAAAMAVVEALGLDQLLLVVANDPWQKSPTRPITPADDRFAMTEALAGSLERVTASRMEIDRGGPSYTIETVEALRSAATVIVLVVGADLVPELGTWKRVDELRELVTLAVVSRPTAVRPPAPHGWRVTWVDGPQVDVSSSEVRAALAAGDPIENLVPEAVIRCIALRNLYAVD